MTPAPDKDTSVPNSYNPSHPLTAFTRFIDEQISNALQSTIGLPSSKEDIQTWQWWKDLENGNHRSQSFGARQEQEKSRQCTQDWVPPSPDPPNFSQQPQTISSVLSELSQALHQLHIVSIPTLFDEMGLFKGTAPSIDTLYQNKRALQELTEYLDRSPYSPTALEEDRNLSNSKVVWRAAFADLINEEHVTSCNSPYDWQREFMDEPDREASSWKRLLLNDFKQQDLKFRQQFETSKPIAATVSAILDKLTRPAQEDASQFRPYITGKSSDNDNHTEQHTNQLVKENRWTEQDFQDMSDQLKKDSEMEQGKPTVTERMTRVKEVTLPDGTIKRTRVLRTSFSDGTSTTETTKETINLARLVEPGTSADIAIIKSTTEEIKESPEVKKGGWFWN